MLLVLTVSSDDHGRIMVTRSQYFAAVLRNKGWTELWQIKMAVNQELTRPVRVVLADDNEAMRGVVAGLLPSGIVLVDNVADGRALVDVASKLKPDIGIIDISMPLMNGIQAALEMKKLGLAVKVVFLTVNEDSDFIDAAFAAGACAYVIKRKMASDLVPALTAALAGRKFVSS